MAIHTSALKSLREIKTKNLQGLGTEQTYRVQDSWSDTFQFIEGIRAAGLNAPRT